MRRFEFAERGGVDDGRHFALQGGLLGLVAPFEHETDFPAIGGPYHVARYPKGPRPDPQFRPPSVGYGRETVGREAGESDAAERISGAGKQFRHGGAQLIRDRAVRVDDDTRGVRHHDANRTVVERIPETQTLPRRSCGPLRAWP